MTDPAELARRCEPPEGTEPGTWHWLKADKKGATNAICVPIEWTGRLWRLSPLVSHGAATPTTTWEYGYRYAAPCLPPEAAALIETQAREIAEARAAIVELMMTFAIMGLSNKIDPRHLPAIRRAQEEPPP